MVRPANNFGPRQHQEKFMPTILNSIKTNKKIPVYGDGKQVRDWLFVKDNVRAIEHIMNNSKSGQVFNISSNNLLENIELIKLILKKLNLPEQLYINYVADRPGHDRDYITSNELLLSTGFVFDDNFEQQLEETINYYLG
jgi:dTDP-glucose 4,6-dehydratase